MTLSSLALPGWEGAGRAHTAFLGLCRLQQGKVSQIWARSLHSSVLANRLDLAVQGFLLEGALEELLG